MAIEAGPPPLDHRTTLREGSRILGLLFIWCLFAAFGYFVVGSLGTGEPGGFFVEVGASLAFVFATLGLLCTFFYVIVRGIKLSGRQST